MIQMPNKSGCVKFKKSCKRKSPFIIYADFE